jgi:hypothetical protein
VPAFNPTTRSRGVRPHEGCDPEPVGVLQRHEIPREEWTGYFDRVTKDHAGQELTIEVLDRKFGDGYEAERLPLAYLEYDDAGDEVAVAAGGRDGRYPVVLRHAIKRPRRIVVDSTAQHIDLALDVIGADDSHTIVTILARPAGGAE